jgi:acyl-CoA synthetase (NDP forming)
LGYVLFKNIIDSGYEGKIYPINPKEREILGHRVYRTIYEVDGEVDLAIISIPGEYVLQSLRDCVRKGVKACVILSAGFGELEDEKGHSIQEKMEKMAKETGMRIVGPNCMGIFDTHSKINASYFREVPMEKGNVAFISQSGAFGEIALHYARNSLLKLSRFVSIGNMVDVDHVEIMEFIGVDENTDVIMLLVEGLKDGRRFIEKARNLSSKKPILVYKIGRTKAGTRAAKSHTGSMAGEYKVFEGACKQSRVLLFKNIDEMLDTTQVLATQPLPSVNGVGIITISGGPSVAISDMCEELGLRVPGFDPEAKERLKEFTSPIAALSNPLDMTPATPSSSYDDCVDIVMSLDYIGGVIAINVGLDSKEFAKAFVKANKKYGKPVIAYVVDTPIISRIFRENGIPVLNSPERCALVFKNLVIRANWVRNGS